MILSSKAASGFFLHKDFKFEILKLRPTLKKVNKNIKINVEALIELYVMYRLDKLFFKFNITTKALEKDYKDDCIHLVWKLF